MATTSAIRRVFISNIANPFTIFLFSAIGSFHCRLGPSQKQPAKIPAGALRFFFAKQIRIAHAHQHNTHTAVPIESQRENYNNIQRRSLNLKVSNRSSSIFECTPLLPSASSAQRPIVECICSPIVKSDSANSAHLSTTPHTHFRGRPSNYHSDSSCLSAIPVSGSVLFVSAIAVVVCASVFFL